MIETIKYALLSGQFILSLSLPPSAPEQQQSIHSYSNDLVLGLGGKQKQLFQHYASGNATPVA